MPKISEARREMRRAQILDAAWRCFYRQGIQATTMEQIITEAGLSASAMYRYFTGKDDIILSAITTSLSELGRLIERVLAESAGLAPPAFVERVTAVIDAFTQREDFNLASIAIHGWSEAQRDERVRVLIRDFYVGFRQRLAQQCERWQAQGTLPASASKDDMAKTLQSLLLGYVVQAAIMQDVTPASHREGIRGLSGKPE